MKTIRDFRFPLLVLLCSTIIVLFTSYGNKKVHPDINALIVKKFLDMNNRGDLNAPEFSQYTFTFYEGTPLRGQSIIKDGLFSEQDVNAVESGFGGNLSEEGPAKMFVQQWIKHGGYSADVPEVPASLRHFFDPTRNEGDRYLTDIANARIMGSLQKYMFTNPRIDGVEWALGKPGDISEAVQDHKYTWEHGKIWMQMALRESKQDKREEYMASAWRALGETLHMIADNGCPSHVRNDAHPSPLWNNNTWFGNPDPYEELVDVIRRDDAHEFSLFSRGKANETLAESFRNAKTAYEIAYSLALFTNVNFVTSETISGTDKNGNFHRQITHPETSYSSPRLNDMSYNKSDFTYYSASGVKQCIDHYYFANAIPKFCNPFVDMECVKSQARVLFPNIIEAGANVIKLFIPKLSVKIESFENGLLKGKIVHRTDEEYPSEIKYAGEVVLTVKDQNGKEVDKIIIEAKNGTFEKNLGEFKFDKDVKIMASIEFGNVKIESPDLFETNDNIFGIYQGTYSMTVNEASWIQSEIDQIDPDLSGDRRRSAEERCRKRVQDKILQIKQVKEGAGGGPIVIFEIVQHSSGVADYENYNLPYRLYNLSTIAFIPKYLCPPSSTESNNGLYDISLKCDSRGFTSTVIDKKGTYTVNGTFQGKNELIGDYAYTYKGNVLFSATYSAKIGHNHISD